MKEVIISLTRSEMVCLLANTSMRLAQLKNLPAPNSWQKELMAKQADLLNKLSQAYTVNWPEPTGHE